MTSMGLVLAHMTSDSWTCIMMFRWCQRLQIKARKKRRRAEPPRVERNLSNLKVKCLLSLGLSGISHVQRAPSCSKKQTCSLRPRWERCYIVFSVPHESQGKQSVSDATSKVGICSCSHACGQSTLPSLAGSVVMRLVLHLHKNFPLERVFRVALSQTRKTKWLPSWTLDNFSTFAPGISSETNSSAYCCLTGLACHFGRGHPLSSQHTCMKLFVQELFCFMSHRLTQNLPCSIYSS